MKKILTILAINVFVSGFLLVPIIQADTEEDHVDLDTILPQLLEKYDVEDKENLDCDVLTDEDFEVIGDAWMEERHPGEDHLIMDNMMGGEGSDTLKAAHIRMGENYLGCGNYKGMMGNGIMSDGAGMMQGDRMMNGGERGLGRFGMMGGGSMMGGAFGGSQTVGILNSVLYLLLLVLVGVLIRYFWIKGGEKRNETK